MNVFYLNKDPYISAREHVDKHVVKMIVEYAQIMSTNHRILDGYQFIEERTNETTGRKYKVKQYKLEDERDDVLYKACHFNHPSTVWARQSNNNYTWLYCMWDELCREYTYRYGKIHKTESLRSALKQLPNNIPVDYLTPPPPAMGKFPECIVPGDSLASYHKYYRVAKSHFAKWTKRDVPEWYIS